MSRDTNDNRAGRLSRRRREEKTRGPDRHDPRGSVNAERVIRVAQRLRAPYHRIPVNEREVDSIIQGMREGASETFEVM